jgi:phospholipid/cholesterol/gamma-HCH transport system substrate-binding protein
VIETKVNFTLVGVFVVALGAALVAGVLWLAAGGAWRQKVDLYMTIMEESVSGLSINASVKFNGVDVGQVRRIRLDPADPERVLVTLAIQRGTPITVDTLAVLKTQGLTGISSIELAGGVRGSAPLVAAVSGELPVIGSKPSLSARLEDVLTGVLAKVERTSTNLDALLSESNRKAVSSSLNDIAKLSHALAARTPSIDAAIGNSAQALADGRRVAATLAADMGPLLARVGRSADALEKMGRDTALASADAASSVQGVGRDVRQVTAQTTPELQRLLAELQMLALSLRRFSDAAERSPSSLLLGRDAVADGPGESMADRQGQR